MTAEGLSCADDKITTSRSTRGITTRQGKLELKAGSKRHQHIVGFEKPKDKQARFALVALDLPAVVESGSGKSD